MKTLEEHEVQIHFSSVLTKVEREGEKFLICRNGKPIADLIPHANIDKAIEGSSEPMATEESALIQRLEQLRPAGIVLPTKKRKRASMPTIEVKGKPLSQMILEDRR